MNKLTIILPTEIPLSLVKKMGFFEYWRKRLREYKKYFCEVEIFSFDKEDLSNDLGLRHFPFSLKLGLPYIDHFLYNLYLLIRAKQMSYVLRVYFSTYFVLKIIKTFFNKKIVLSYHYYYANTSKLDYNVVKGFFAKCLEISSVRAADKVFVTTAELQNWLLNKYHKNSIVISNPIDNSIFYPEGEKDKYILYAGRLIQNKGITFLLEAFKIINSVYPNYSLRIFGGFEREITKFSKIASMIRVKNVSWHGYIPHEQLAKYMKKAIAIVLPTITSEGQPKVLMEAMASGTVCIATDVPGNREIIINNYNGILVPAKDSLALANAIISVISNTQLRKQLISNGLEMVKKLDIESIIRKEVEVIEGLFKNK